MKVYGSAPVQVVTRLLATLGDRVAVDHATYSGEFAGGPWEVDMLRVTELDADGRLRASITFDLEDRHGAFDEAVARFGAGEGAGGFSALAPAFARARRTRDWDAFRECLAEDAAICDHRVPGLFNGDRDWWVRSLRELQDLAPDLDVEIVRMLAWDRNRWALMLRTFGTSRDGTAFENFLVLETDGERVRRLALFDVADVDRALAGFAELGAGPAARAV